uniref:CD63 molecule n=1 Tax=Xiphophorus couchianus TaxID=32473 RepID=A0A3B5M4Q9_9TELE
MAVEGGMKCVKYVLFCFNFISLFCGLALIVVGVVVQVSMHKTFRIMDVNASAGPIILIVVGLLTFFVAFFGCCGAWKENHCMVATWKCCGAQNTSDWKDYGSDGKSVPDSCCLEVKPGCGNGTMTDTAKVHQQVKYIYFVLAVGLLGIVFACLLMRAIRGGYEVM